MSDGDESVDQLLALIPAPREPRAVDLKLRRGTSFGDPYRRTLMIACAKRGLPLRECLRAAGISNAAFYAWQKKAEERPNGRHAEFINYLDRIMTVTQLEIVDEVRAASKGTLDQHGIHKSQWQAGAFLLRHLSPETFGDRKKVEITNTSVQKTSIMLSKLSDEDLERLMEIQQRALASGGPAEDVIEGEIIENEPDEAGDLDAEWPES